MALNQTQLDALDAELDGDDIVGFYALLESYGDSYGALGSAVTNNDTWQGELANAFAAYAAGDDSVVLSYESTAWTSLNKAVAEGYLAAYVANSGNAPTRAQIQTAHNNAYAAAGLDADDWFPNKLLNDSADPDALWADFVTNEGGGDLVDDAFTVFGSGGKFLVGPYLLYKALADGTLDQDALEFAKNFANALANMSGNARDDMYTDVGNDLAGLLAQFGEGVLGLIPDFSGALGDPGSLLDKVLPDWLDGPLGLFGDAKTTGSPLVCDLDSDGIELTTFNAATTTTFFDLDGDGFAEQTAWVSADDGLLVRDLDASGTIDSVNELFGSPSIDGFALLAELDSNDDLFIDANDTGWGDLRIWQDTNGDAVTQAGELLTLGSLDIVSISLLDVEASTSTISGNAISHTSTFKYANGSTDAIVDAWFVHDDVNTFYTGDYTLDTRALFLPTLRGFGKLPDLHIAVSGDATLRGLVENFAVGWDFAIFDDLHDLDGVVEDILYTWAGVEAVNPSSRGLWVDAQHLEFLEECFGDEWLQWGTQTGPYANAGALLEQAWDVVYKTLKGQLLIQAGADALFTNTITYNAFTGELDGTFALSQSAIDDLVNYATATGVSTLLYWNSIAELIDITMGLSNLTATEEGWLDTALYDSGLSETWEDVEELYLGGDTTGSTTTGDSSNETINGGSLDDTLTGGGGTDTINGNDGDDWIRSHTASDSAGDTLNGGNGHDVIEGNNGNDTLTGGAGNDTIEAGAGDDDISAGSGGDTVEGGTGEDGYHYSSGDDVYSDTGALNENDTIYLPSGIDSGDLTFFRLGTHDLLIEVAGLGTIQLLNQLNSYAGSFIETIEFYDTTTLSLSALATPETHGTEAGEYIYGITSGTADDDDVIFGYGGDDTIDGNGGSDWIDGGAGNDSISVSESGLGETNTVRASAGFDNVIAGANATDVLLIPDGYSTDDVHLYRLSGSPNDLTIQIDGLGQVVVPGHFYWGNAYLDEVHFEDESPTLDISQYEFTTHGTSGGETLNAVWGTSGSDDNVIYGYEGNDTLNGNGTGDDKLHGGEGNDYISAAGGDDEAYGGDGTDSIYGGTGNDTLYGDAGADTIQGEKDNDIIYGGDGDDYLYGGITSSHGAYVGDDELYGGDGDDYLYAENGTNIIDGGAGDDTLIGGDNADTYFYSSGLDTITDSWGTDVLHMSGGITVSDLTFSSVSTYNTKITVTTSVDELTVTNQRHPTAGLRIETISFDDGFTADLANYQSWQNGTSGADSLSGDANDNVIIGFAGGDTIGGGAGADHVHGGDGADTIHGDGGDDLLHGGEGDDMLYGDDGLDALFGGGGADTFMFENASAFNDVDVVNDFDVSTDNDVLDISDILDNTGYQHGTDAVTDWVELTTVGSDTAVKIDLDGTGGSYGFDQVATLTGITGLTDEAALVTSGNLLVA